MGVLMDPKQMFPLSSELNASNFFTVNERNKDDLLYKWSHSKPFYLKYQFIGFGISCLASINSL